jgi:hypothetical protein
LPGLAAVNLIVLGRDASGAKLWGLSASGQWTVSSPVPGATSIARFGPDVAVAGAARVDLRVARAFGSSRTQLPLEWPGRARSDPSVALSESPGGAIAIVTQSATGFDYWLAGTGGAIVPLRAAPANSFSPDVAWLDEAQLLVLATGSDQVSRLAVVEPESDSLTTLASPVGVRDFALSMDRQFVAAATERAVYSGPVMDFLGGGHPVAVEQVTPGTVTWALSLDDTGTHLAILVGTVAADGSVSAVRDVGYRRSGSAWMGDFNVAVPFDEATGQVWVT